MVRWIIVLVIALAIGLFVYVDINNKEPKDLGVSEGLLKPCPTTPNCVSSQADPEDNVHYVEPIIYHGDRKDMQLKLESYFLQQGNAQILSSQLGYVHLAVKSAIFGFVDDVEFYLPESDSVVHVRSASRVGYSDLEGNRQRVRQVRDLLVH